MRNESALNIFNLKIGYALIFKVILQHFIKGFVLIVLNSVRVGAI